jgi:ketosteroid isomerase-like protein
MMVEPKSNRELVESFYEAVGEKEVHQERGISTGDIDHLRRIFAEDIEWIHPALGGAFHGANSVIDDVIIPAGNKVLEPVADVWDLKDGQIVRFRQYIDTASLKKQMEG